jgi:2-desacetyl-2-hydroxyethyl bacteriochlorophyllide A dehydrogenase
MAGEEIMKAAVLESVRQIVVKDIPPPRPHPDEVVIKVKTCGMCGTDLKLYTGQYTARIPVVPGHEYSGEIVEVGSNVKNLKVGQKVVSDPNESCGKCYWCRNHQPCFCNDLAAYGVLRDGGFAEYCTATEKGVYPIPDGVDDEVAAFAEPVSCVVHAADRINYRSGETVVILGGGPLGQIHLQFALNSGAGKVILVDPNKTRRQLATKFGAQVVIDPKDGRVKEQAFDETNALGADVVIEAVGRTETIEQAFELAKRGGRVIIFGFAPEGQKASFIPFNVLSRELTIMGAWVNPYSYSRALDVLSSGRIDVKPLISNRLKLDHIMDGYKMMAEKPAGFMKSLVSP